MFTFNSLNIYPQEIESEIRQYPSVTDALILPKKSSVHGNIPIALIVFNQNLRPDLSALRKFVKKRVGVRSPRHYIIVDEIPTNTSGKISRIEASKLTQKSDQIRREIINLLDEKYKQHVKLSHRNEFIEGKRDLSFRKFQMDSLARMDLLVSLETQYDIVITPQEFARYRTFGKLASRILTKPKEGINQSVEQQNYLLEMDTDRFDKLDKEPPYIVRLFKRFYSYCSTVAELNRLLANLEERLTPLDIDDLAYFHVKSELIPNDAEPKFQFALSFWLNETKHLMSNSGKKAAELFVLKKVAREMTLFSNPRIATPKTVLICFTPRGVRHLMMPNAVLLQHIDATKFDLLLIPEVDNNYKFGTFPFGRKLHQQAQWLMEQAWFEQYKQIRTLGYSAGSFPAIAFGHLLNAERALSIAGRFHKKKHPLVNLDKIATTWQVLKKGRCDRVLMSYSINNKRDQKFAKFFAKVCKGKEILIEVKAEKLPHLMLRPLVERGELASYFSQTLFAPIENSTLMNRQQRESISFPIPSNKI